MWVKEAYKPTEWSSFEDSDSRLTSSMKKLNELHFVILTDIVWWSWTSHKYLGRWMPSTQTKAKKGSCILRKSFVMTIMYPLYKIWKQLHSQKEHTCWLCTGRSETHKLHALLPPSTSHSVTSRYVQFHQNKQSQYLHCPRIWHPIRNQDAQCSVCKHHLICKRYPS